MAADFFLKIDGAPGDSQTEGHKGEIQVESWSWGASNPTSGYTEGEGLGAGKVQMQDFHFTMKNSKASPVLMQHCATGKHIPSAVLTCRKAGGKQETFLKVTFNNLLISSYQTGGSAGGEVPFDSISFNYTEMLMETFGQKADGTVGPTGKAGYNLKTQTKK